jgi:energy-converting hydrogenase Eha subunit A
MTNHVHLLITPEFAQGVSLVMRDLGRHLIVIAVLTASVIGTTQAILRAY